MKKKNKTSIKLCESYALRFNELDNSGDKILPNSFNVKDFEQMKIAGKILDYEIDTNGVRVIKKMDIISVSM